MTRRIIKCPHYKGSGYGYTDESVEFLLCDDCNELLTKETFNQLVLETSMQKTVNVMLQNQIDKLKENNQDEERI